MQMLSPPTTEEKLTPRENMVIKRSNGISAKQYLTLYQLVGQCSRWPKRDLLEIENILQNPQIDVILLYLEEKIVGLAELDRRQFPDIEIKYFGLLPEFIGQGLGSFFVDRIFRFGWNYTPNRLWGHIVDCDHPNAINTYERAGAHIYKQEIQ